MKYLDRANYALPFWSAYLPTFFWASLIFLLSQTPDLNTGLSFDFVLRKFGHAIVYALLGFLFLCGKRWRRETPATTKMFLFLFLYAISDEIHQWFVPSRHFALTDILIDTTGGILAFFSFKVWTRIFPSA